MKYSEGKTGRIFVIKFDHGDDLNTELEKFIMKEKIKTAFFIFLGGVKSGKMVAGPKKAVMPPEPAWVDFSGGWEVFGTGSVFMDSEKKPCVHIHTSMGRSKKTLTGCIRKDSRVFGAVETVLYEVKGAKASKGIDAATGLKMLKIG